VVAGLAFWVGGRAIHEFSNTGRLLAEIEGIVLAVVSGGLGVVAKAAGEHFAADEEDGIPSSEASPMDNGKHHGYGTRSPFQ
jgi:hypothetical protein